MKTRLLQFLQWVVLGAAAVARSLLALNAATDPDHTGKGYNAMLRLYSPLEPFLIKTWRPGEIELVK